MPNESARQLLTKIDKQEFNPVVRHLTRAWLGNPPADIEPMAQALLDTRMTFGELAAMVTDAKVTNRAGIYPEHIRAFLSTGTYGGAIEAGLNDSMQTEINDMLAPIMPVLRPVTVPSYQPVGVPRCDASEYPYRSEGAEIPYAKIEYSGEIVQLKKYAQILVHTRESLLTGEGLQVLQAEIAGLASAASRRIIAEVVTALATTTLKDGAPLFDAAYGNDLTGAFDIAGLSAATSALAEMVPTAGTLPSGIQAKFLIVPTILEQEAKTLIAATALEQGSVLRVVPIPGLPSNEFFVCESGSSRALIMGQFEGGPTMFENVTPQMIKTMSPIDAEAYRSMLEFCVVPASRHIIKTTIV